MSNNVSLKSLFESNKGELEQKLAGLRLPQDANKVQQTIADYLNGLFDSDGDFRQNLTQSEDYILQAAMSLLNAQQEMSNALIKQGMESVKKETGKESFPFSESHSFSKTENVLSSENEGVPESSKQGLLNIKMTSAQALIGSTGGALVGQVLLNGWGAVFGAIAGTAIAVYVASRTKATENNVGNSIVKRPLLNHENQGTPLETEDLISIISGICDSVDHLIDTFRAQINRVEILKKAQVHVCFKQAPKDINGEAEKIMIRFMQEVYKRIRANNAGALTDNNHLVYIATPSGWDKATQKLYVKMAQKAGLPILDDGVTKESRAAFVKSQHDATSGMGRNVERGAIVFDMGSSTLDFTYMNKNLDHLIDHGYDCGASKVEKLIFAQKEKDSKAIQLFEKKYPQLTDYLLFEARKFKEQIYFDPSLRVKKTINFEDFIDDEELEDENYKMAFMPGELNAMLEREGYIDSIEQAMMSYKRDFIPNQSIYGVFLTGGASRMDFIKDLVCKCWNVKPEQVYRDNDPSLTISQGVAEVARMDLRTEGMDEGLGEAINRLMNNDDIFDTFIDDFGHELWDKVTDAVAAVINYFGETEEDDYSINALQEAISISIRDTIKEVSPQASNFMQGAIETHLKDIQAKVDDIIKHYAQQGINTNVSYKVAVPNISDINLDGVMDSISERIAEESSQWSGAITSAAIGSIVGALIFGGPLGWIVGGALLIGQLIFGDTEEEKKAKAMAKDLDLEDRQKVRNELANKWDDIQEKIAQSIYDSLTGDSQIKQAINKCVKQTLESYRENLKSARILID